MKSKEKSMTRIRKTSLEKFIQHESSAGILLCCSSLLAIVMANSPANMFYELLIETPLTIQIGAFILAKPLLLWVNDGLMTIFFVLIGLELKRKILEGELSNTRKILLPAFGAIGGLVIPVMIYVYFNINDPVAIKGWGIPAATDIAFALGVLSLLGSRVPSGLKVFLTSLAIFDDIGLIIIIAFFYTSKISFFALLISLGCLIILFLFNWCGIAETSIYVIVGVFMWVAVLKSGVHATLAGVLFAMFIPMKSKKDRRISPLKAMEHDIHATVAYVVLPVFAFCNFGIHFHGLTMETLLHNVSLGIAFGLFFGKQIGVFVFCWLGVKLKLAALPKGISWPVFYGASVLTGIGFTISLFKGSLAFEETGVNLMYDERIGILLGSIASGFLGYLILFKYLGPPKTGQ
jgi:NhaA family Na+:H+ antiporter